jgi:sugar phosphate isomerase/epimerase
MSSSPFTAEAVGICPATLLTDPMTCDAADLRRIARASAGAGFSSFSLWSFYATANGLDATRALLDDSAITVRAVEAATKWPEGPSAAAADAEQQLDVASALGADLLLACTLLPTVDLERATDGFAALCEHAQRRGVRVAIEFLPWSAIPDLATAWRVVHNSGAKNGGIVIDTLHWQRQPGGPNFDVLRRIPGEHVHYVQVCDAAPGRSGTHDYMAEALGARLLPGAGMVDIRALIRAIVEIGADPYFAFEVFNTGLAKNGADAMAAQLRAAATTLFD